MAITAPAIASIFQAIEKKRVFLSPFKRLPKTPTTFSFISHWPKFSHMTILVAREAGKYNLSVGYWKNHYKGQTIIHATLLL